MDLAHHILTYQLHRFVEERVTELFSPPPHREKTQKNPSPLKDDIIQKTNATKPLAPIRPGRSYKISTAVTVSEVKTSPTEENKPDDTKIEELDGMESSKSIDDEYKYLRHH